MQRNCRYAKTRLVYLPTEAGLGSTGLNRVPITTPAGSEQFATEEYNGAYEQAGRDER